MRLAVIDASPIGGGPISRALDAAAREAVPSPGRLPTVRLFDIFVGSCASCSACMATGRCTSRAPRVEEAAAMLGGADALVLGVPSHLHVRDPRAVALLRRLVGGFAGIGVVRGVDDERPGPRTLKTAVLISSAPPLMGALAQLGLMPTGLSAVWHMLDRAHVDVVATASVSPRFSGPASWDRARSRGRGVGRALAIALRPPPQVVPSPTRADARLASTPRARIA